MTEPGDIGAPQSPSDLFSMDAADNAEVVPPFVPRGPESMWSTEVKQGEPDIGSDELESAAPLNGQDAAGEPPAAEEARPRPGFGVGSTPHADQWHDQDGMPAAGNGTGNGSPFATAGVFRSEPVVRDSEIIDEDPIDDVIDADEVWTPTGPGPSVFSSGSARSTPEADRHTQSQNDPWVSAEGVDPSWSSRPTGGLWGSQPADRPVAARRQGCGAADEIAGERDIGTARRCLSRPARARRRRVTAACRGPGTGTGAAVGVRRVAAARRAGAGRGHRPDARSAGSGGGHPRPGAGGQRPPLAADRRRLPDRCDPGRCVAATTAASLR